MAIMFVLGSCISFFCTVAPKKLTVFAFISLLIGLAVSQFFFSQENTGFQPLERITGQEWGGALTGVLVNQITYIFGRYYPRKKVS